MATNNAFTDYKKRLDLNKKNAQVELDTANRKANMYMDNYLKYAGLQGSGLGQTAYTQQANNYQNKLNDLNTNYNSQLESYRQTFNANKQSELENRTANMGYEQAMNYIQRQKSLGEEGIDASTYQTVQDNINTNLIKNASVIKNNLYSQYLDAVNSNDIDNQKRLLEQYNNINTAINNASDTGNYNDLYKTYQGLATNPNDPSTLDENGNLQLNRNLYTSDYKQNQIKNYVNQAGGNKYVDQFFDLVNSGKYQLEDGKIYDMNKGFGKALFIYNANTDSFTKISDPNNNSYVLLNGKRYSLRNGKIADTNTGEVIADFEDINDIIKRYK